MRERDFYLAAIIMDGCLGAVFFSIPLLVLRVGGSVLDMGIAGTVGASAYAVWSPIAGRLADKVKKKGMVVASALSFALILMGTKWISHISHILVMMSLIGVSLASFFPPLQVGLSSGKDQRALSKALGNYNVSWTTGLFLGAIMGGFLFELDWKLPFYFSALGSLFLAIGVFFSSHKGEEPRTKKTQVYGPDPEPFNRKRYLLVGWIANFISWFIIATIRNIFPKLAVELGIDPHNLGILLAIPYIAQVVTFMALGRSKGWHYRVLPIVSVQILALGALAIIFAATHQILFVFAFVFLGLSSGVTYFSSIFYSLHTGGRKGKKAGLHESILGSGALLGPILGGWGASLYGLRAPYVICFCLLLLGISVEISLLRFRPGKTTISIFGTAKLRGSEIKSNF